MSLQLEQWGFDKIADDHLSSHSEPWQRLIPKVRERLAAASAGERDAIRHDVERALNEQSRESEKRPILLELEAKKKGRFRPEKCFVGPAGLLIVATRGSWRWSIVSAYFVESSGDWRDVCRKILRQYCQIREGVYEVPSQEAEFVRPGRTRRKRERRVLLKIPEHFGIAAEGVTTKRQLSFPNWEAAIPYLHPNRTPPQPSESKRVPRASLKGRPASPIYRTGS